MPTYADIEDYVRQADLASAYDAWTPQDLCREVTPQLDRLTDSQWDEDLPF